MLRPSAARGPSLLESERLARIQGIVHGFTTRSLGDAAPGGASDQPDPVERALGGLLRGWTRRQVVQVHGARAVEGQALDGLIPEADALVSSRPGDLLIIRTADCLPILLVALERNRAIAVAAVHAGWRGLVAGVVQNGVALLRAQRPAASLVAAIGPSIGPCCFEVGPEVAPQLASLGPGLVSPGRGDRSLADLPRAACQLLTTLGVEVEAAPPPCTLCEPDRFHSHRAAGTAAGRMASFIGIAP